MTKLCPVCDEIRQYEPIGDVEAVKTVGTRRLYACQSCATVSVIAEPARAVERARGGQG